MLQISIVQLLPKRYVDDCHSYYVCLVFMFTMKQKLQNQTFLKLFQHYIKSRVLEDEVNRMIVKLADCVKRRSVIGINECQVFDIE